MRLWSVHPRYLDTKGLVALWREALLAKHVLEGKTTGYRNHPQLDRFKKSTSPVNAINFYLSEVYNEACARGYSFDRKKIGKFRKVKMSVTSGQVEYERQHLLAKLKSRAPVDFHKLEKLKSFSVHPVFKIRRGEIEPWEIVK